MMLRLLPGFLLLSSSSFAATPIVDNARIVHSELLKVLATRQPPILDRIAIKPLPVPVAEEIVLKVTGTRAIRLSEGQRNCDCIRADWTLLDALYTRVNTLLVEMNKTLTDESLNRLRVATEQLAAISARLGEDGNRQIDVSWSAQNFAAALPPQAPVSLNWQQLVYVNVDGVSRLANPKALQVVNPIEKGGVFLQIEASAERACSDNLEIRLDGRGLVTPFDIKSKAIPLYVSLL